MFENHPIFTQKWKIECGFFSKDYGIGIGKTVKMIEKLSAAATMFGGRQAIFATLVLQSHERTIICLNDQSIGLFIATKYITAFDKKIRYWAR